MLLASEDIKQKQNERVCFILHYYYITLYSIALCEVLRTYGSVPCKYHSD